MIVRTPLIIEDATHVRKRNSFKGTRKVPGREAWLPNDRRPTHSDGNVKVNADGKHDRRAGDPLRIADQVDRQEPKRKPMGSSILVRTDLMLDHDSPS